MDREYFMGPETQGPDGSRTMDFDRNPTVLLVFAANRFTRDATRFLQQNYGIGAMDWRTLVMLTKEPDTPVARASQVMGIDKAAVSRAFASLNRAGLVTASVPAGDSRRKNWRLTERGQALHNEMLDAVLDRQQEILKGFSDQEVTVLNDLFLRLITNIEALGDENA